MANPLARPSFSVMKTAIVLFNLGGPDRPESVQPFLFNLFNDPAIIGLPWLLRRFLAGVISKRRAPIAREIYDQIGGSSPLLANTIAQADGLTGELADLGTVQTFIAMRYWHPMTDETVKAVSAFKPDRIVLLPLYPQYSTTTTGSSLKAWHKAAAKAGLRAPTSTVCCYPQEDGFIEAAAASIRARYDLSAATHPTRILFSAHGLPEKIIKAGDPYQWQVEQTASAIVEKLGIADLDWSICYQSRVGPLKWIGPSTEAEIARAGEDKAAIVLFPIAFVSEHSETLVELDIEYRHLAEEAGVPMYDRVPTVGVATSFIAGLAKLVRQAVGGAQPVISGQGGRICSKERCGCAWEIAA
jgi:ferrochelatase